MQEGETGNTVKKRPDNRASIKTLLVRPHHAGSVVRGTSGTLAA
jgi:hypothetical protein